MDKAEIALELLKLTMLDEYVIDEIKPDADHGGIDMEAKLTQEIIEQRIQAVILLYNKMREALDTNDV